MRPPLNASASRCLALFAGFSILPFALPAAGARDDLDALGILDPFAQQAYLKPVVPNLDQDGNFFGFSVAASGNTIVVGAPRADNLATQGFQGGAAYVFVRSGATWIEQARLLPAAIGTWNSQDWFGWSVAISGNTIVVGAINEDSNSTGINSVPDELSEEAGAAYVFVRNGTTWTQQAYLKPGAIGSFQVREQFGISVAVSGDTVVVGAHGESSSTTGVNSEPNEGAGLSGAAYVFVRSGTTWTQQAYLKPAEVGASQALDRFGYSVAVSGDIVAVGAKDEDSSSTGVNSVPNEGASFAGAAYVFARTGSTWSQEAYLKPGAVRGTQGSANFGWSVAASGVTVVVGAHQESSGTTGVNTVPDNEAPSSGAAYVYVREGSAWTQQAYLKPAAVGTTQSQDTFGSSVALSGDILVVGARGEDSSTTGVNTEANEDASRSGAAYVFVRSGTAWVQQAYLKPAAVGTTQAEDELGFSAAISGDTVVVGAYREDSGTTGVNTTANESSVDSGAAYVFVTVPLFADGFESGNTIAWSSVEP
jgi:hypothetical protein